jgi:thioredoxin 1
LIEINQDNFDAEITQEQRPVLLDFWGPKCEPCKALMPFVEQLAGKYGDSVKFCKLNTAENRRLAIKQRVLGLPTIAIYKAGQKVEELTQDNATPENIEEMVKRYI